MPALRLLATRGRVITGRPAIVLAAARARRGGRAYSLWPDAHQPMIAADLAYPPAADWLRRTVVPTLRRLPDAAGWMALRAGAVLVGDRDGLAARLGEPVLGEPPRVAMFSPAGQAVSKVICFLFAAGDDAPRLVVKAMAEPRFGPRLRAEYEVLASVRDRVAHDARVIATIPPAPHLADERFGEFMVAEPFDPLGAASGSARREDALRWLRDFQAASSTGERPWDAGDERWALDHTTEAWRLAGRPSAAAVVARVRTALTPLRGTAMPRCIVHGDFWRGNIAARDGAIRVFDWEWSGLDGTPVVDLWTYELAELRIAARTGEPLDEPLATALAGVERELGRRGLDERLALAMLGPVLGALSFRVRRRLRMPDEMERPSIAVMEAAERLLFER